MTPAVSGNSQSRKMTKVIESKAGVQYRMVELNRETITEERTVELSFSSEEPCESYHWDLGRYMEVLDHSGESCDLSRLNNGGALLMDHDRRDQIGVVEKAWIGDDKKGRAKVRFGSSPRAQEIFQDVKEGIRRLVSVGYRISKLVTEKVENEVETLRAMAWTPMEISIVSVPADTTVGIGRSNDASDTHKQTIERTMKVNLHPNPPEGGGGSPTPAPNPAAPTIITPEQWRQEQAEMFTMARRHNQIDLYQKAINEGQDLTKFRKTLLDAIQSQPIAGTPETAKGREGNQSFGEMLVNSEAYRNAVKSRAHRNVSLELPMLGTRATLLTTTGLTGYERPAGITLLEQQPLTIAQLFSQGETSQPTIRIMKETSYTNAATAVAEEGQKPEASFDLEEADFGVKKIAVVGRVSDEMFADFPAVRDYVNSRMVYMVQSKEDNHLLNGTGNSNQITGVLATSNIQTEAASNSSTIADAIHKAITKVRSTGFFAPDAIVMHPNDWQDLRLTKDSNGQYYAGGPFGGQYGVGGYSANGPLWGLPVVVTTSITEGTALVGAFRIGGQIFRRMGVTVDTTNSDASDFQYNRICIRVETRLALVIYRPLAFCTVTGIA